MPRRSRTGSKRRKTTAADGAERPPNAAPEADAAVEAEPPAGTGAAPEAPAALPEAAAAHPAEPEHGTNGTRPQARGIAADAGLYGVLGVPPSASDPEIQTSYRREASRLLSNGSAADIAALRRLNAAYEVLGNSVRRAEYDQARRLPPSTVLRGPSEAVRPDAKQAMAVTRRRRPRQVVVPRQAGLPEVLVVVLVIALSVAAASLIIPRVSVNLSVLNQLSGILPGVSTSRRAIIEATVTPAPVRTPTAAPPSATATVLATGLSEHFEGSTVTVSSANPPANTPETVLIRLRRDGQPAANVEVWSTVQYRTTQERWPASGTVRTDSTGTASIIFNVGPATPGYPVEVHVFAQVDGDQLSWSTTFTPR
ncbi:MAG TPA: DnaJ domain-containing protein [Chloroflexota bacterium]|nr:DnaJ domain-containing protein [Chloroflexota bacterium]